MVGGRPTLAHIDLKALDHNVRQVRALVGGRKVLAVVKAEAYGHGSVEVARRLEAGGAEMLGVALVEEGAKLRQAGIMAPILVLGGVFDWQVADVIAHGLTPVIYTRMQAVAFSKAAAAKGMKLPVHFKVDTGMGRVGLQLGEAVDFIMEAHTLPGLSFEGIMTHLADADGPDKNFAEYQIFQFKSVVGRLEEAGITFEHVHAAGSAAIIEFEQALFNMVRPGIMLYGCYPSERMRAIVDLKPVLSLKTRIMHLKEVAEGISISYGRRFYTARPSLIATLPIGYADGLDRKLSNTGQVLIEGKRVPIVGRVCMDLTMVDVTDLNEVKVGDEAVIIGSQGGQEIPAEEVAGLLDTISYEVLCNISARVPRVYNY